MMDWDQMALDLAAIRADNEQAITLRRAGTPLAPQTVRIARTGGSGRAITGEGTLASVGRVVILGGTGFNVQAGDRFTDAYGVLYEVVFVRPNRRAAVVAEAQVVQ